MVRASRRNPRPGTAFTFIEVIARPLLAVLCKRDWRGRENVPREGGVIVVANHVTYFDPISIGHFLVKAGRTPRFLAKAGVFKAPVLGKLIRSAGQIPVYRESREAALAFREAVQAVQRGETIIVYPEGTMTKDPQLWPMAGKTGAARIALRTGAPVLPIGQWGAQEVFPHYSTKPHFFPRKTLRVTAGEPMDLRAIFGPEINAESLRAGTELIMDRITELVAGIRGEEPPAVRFDPAARAENGDGDEKAAENGEVPSVPAATTSPDAAAEQTASEPAASVTSAPDSTVPESPVTETPVPDGESAPAPEARA